MEQVDPANDGYMRDCAEGQAGYMVCRGGNVMRAYVKNDEGTNRVLRDGWYLGLLDVAFSSRIPTTGWRTSTGSDGTRRSSSAGGANYVRPDQRGTLAVSSRSATAFPATISTSRRRGAPPGQRA